jgi:hypothetical protein
MRLVCLSVASAAVVMMFGAGTAAAQSYYAPPPPASAYGVGSWGQPYQYGGGHPGGACCQPGGYQPPRHDPRPVCCYGGPRQDDYAYQGRHDRGGRYGYSDSRRYYYGEQRYEHREYRREARYEGDHDAWGYDDDRPPSARGYRNYDPPRRPHRHDANCGCGDVYLYDR